LLPIECRRLVPNCQDLKLSIFNIRNKE